VLEGVSGMEINQGEIVSIKAWVSSVKRGEAGIWSASALIVGGLTLTLLAGAALHYEFIGKETKLIHLCKQNPSIDPSECARLLELRRSPEPKRKDHWTDPRRERGFSLAGEGS